MDRQQVDAMCQGDIADDLLFGAAQIAAFLFRGAGRRRKVYNWAEKGRLPVFRLGAVLCARKSVLLAWIAEQEQRGLRGVPGYRPP